MFARPLAALLGLLLATWLPVSEPANAGLLPKARAELGIDAATREFLAVTLPKQWEKYVDETVRKTLARIDGSVKLYIELLDETLSKQISEAQCRVVAAGGGIIDDILRRFPWLKQPGSPERFRSHSTAETSRLTADSSPGFVKDIYNGLMQAANIMACEAGAPATLKADARKVGAELTAKWLVWNRAESLRCPTAAACLEAYRKEIDEIVRKANSRDVADSKAAQDLLRLAPAKPPSRWNWLASSPAFKDLEDGMTSLYKIENALGAARVFRDELALKKFKLAETPTAEAKREIDRIITTTKNYLRTAPNVTCEFFFNAAAGLRQNLAAPRAHVLLAETYINDALALSDIGGAEGTERKANITFLSDRANKARAFCAP